MARLWGARVLAWLQSQIGIAALVSLLVGDTIASQLCLLVFSRLFALMLIAMLMMMIRQCSRLVWHLAMSSHFALHTDHVFVVFSLFSVFNLVVLLFSLNEFVILFCFSLANFFKGGNL